MSNTPKQLEEKLNEIFRAFSVSNDDGAIAVTWLAKQTVDKAKQDILALLRTSQAELIERLREAGPSDTPIEGMRDVRIVSRANGYNSANRHWRSALTAIKKELELS